MHNHLAMAPAMLCKRKAQTSSTNLHPKRFQKRFMAVWWKLMNPQGREWILRYLQNTKITLQAKVSTSMTHYNLVHKFIPMPQAMNIPDAKAAVDKEWKTLETIPAWKLEKVKSKKEVTRLGRKLSLNCLFARRNNNNFDLCRPPGN